MVVVVVVGVEIGVRILKFTFTLKLHFQVTVLDVAALERVLQFAQEFFKHDNTFKHTRLLVVLDPQLVFGRILITCAFGVECVDLVDDESEEKAEKTLGYKPTTDQ